MPKFDNPESQAMFDATIYERKFYAAQHLVAVLRAPNEDVETKAKTFVRAVEHASSNGLHDHSYFGKCKNPKRRLMSFYKLNWASRKGRPGIRDICADDCGVVVDVGHGLLGIKRANKRGAALRFAWQLIQQEAETDIYNHGVEAARELLRIDAPRVVQRLLTTNRIK